MIERVCDPAVVVCLPVATLDSHRDQLPRKTESAKITHDANGRQFAAAIPWPPFREDGHMYSVLRSVRQNSLITWTGPFAHQAEAICRVMKAAHQSLRHALTLNKPPAIHKPTTSLGCSPAAAAGPDLARMGQGDRSR